MHESCEENVKIYTFYHYKVYNINYHTDIKSLKALHAEKSLIHFFFKNKDESENR